MAAYKEGDRVRILEVTDEDDTGILCIKPADHEVGLEGTVVAVVEYSTLPSDYNILIGDDTIIVDEAFLTLVEAA